MGIVVAAGLMLAVSACGVDSSAVSSQAGSAVRVEAGPAVAGVQGATLIAQAATDTSALTTGQFAGSGSLTGSMSGSVSITGSFDRTAQAASVTATFGGAGDGTSFSSVFIGGTAYVQTGSVSMLGIDTPWLSLDVAKLADKLASDPGLDGLFPGGGSSPGSNPDSFLDVLRGVSGAVTTVGPEDVRGEPTTHYKADVLPSKALDQLPADHQQALREMLGAELDQPIPVDVWIDGNGLVRKVSASRSIGTDGSVTGQFEFFDLGQPVSITAPPAGQVTRAEDLPLLKDLFGN